MTRDIIGLGGTTSVRIKRSALAWACIHLSRIMRSSDRVACLMDRQNTLAVCDAEYAYYYSERTTSPLGL